MSDDKHTAWNWGPAVRRRLARVEKALQASIGPDARFESGASQGEAPEWPGDNVLGYGGASGGEGDTRQRRLKPSQRGLETLQAIVAELSRLESGEDVSPHTEPEDTAAFDVPEGFLLDAGADDQSEYERMESAEPHEEGDASSHPPLDFEEMLKLIEELQKQPREDPDEQPPGA